MLFILNGAWASSLIRGEQIASKLGALCGDYPCKDQVVIMIKCYPTNPILIPLMKRLYIDLVDSDGILGLARKIPAIKLIVLSNLAKEYVSARVENEVIVIPEQHCNDEKFIRNRKEVTTVGYVGSELSFDLNIEEITKRLSEINLQFKFLFCEDLSLTRKDIVDFYKSIDIQVCFRKPRLLPYMPPELKNPLKLANAGSFKIPSVSYPELNYKKEFDSCFLSVYDLNGLIDTCKRLKQCASLYACVSRDAYDCAEKYHIDNIIPFYKELAV